MDIETSYKLLVADLKVVNENLGLLHAQLGDPFKIKGQDSRALWDALQTLGSTILDLETNNELLEDAILSKVLYHLENHQLLQQTALRFILMENASKTSRFCCSKSLPSGGLALPPWKAK
jgi:hypothetical protein